MQVECFRISLSAEGIVGYHILQSFSEASEFNEVSPKQNKNLPKKVGKAEISSL